MTQPSPPITRVLYAPRPFTDYCPSTAPDSCVLWYAVQGKTDDDIGAACWNLIWLSTPDLDRLLTIDRRPGPHWKAVTPNVQLSALVQTWSELRHTVLCDPSVFKAWLMRHRDDWMFAAAEELLPIVFERLDEAIARCGGADLPGHARMVKRRDNVAYVDFAEVLGAGPSPVSALASAEAL